MHLVFRMTNPTLKEIINNRVVCQFYNSAQKHEAGLTAFIAKSCGYPRAKGWHDELDMRLGIFLEDYAREKDLTIASYDERNDGKIYIIYTDEVVNRFSSWK